MYRLALCDLGCVIDDRKLKKRSAIDWSRVIHEWEVGQSKLPSSHGKKTSSRAEIAYLKLFLESNLITAEDAQ